MALANVPPRVAQALMRHSTIILTMDRYGHAKLHDVASAVEKLPPLLVPAAPIEPISEHLATHLPLDPDGAERSLTVADGTTDATPPMIEDRNPLEMTGLDVVGGN
jgi:hypothetical protein